MVVTLQNFVHKGIAKRRRIKTDPKNEPVQTAPNHPPSFVDVFTPDMQVEPAQLGDAIDDDGNHAPSEYFTAAEYAESLVDLDMGHDTGATSSTVSAAGSVDGGGVYLSDGTIQETNIFENHQSLKPGCYTVHGGAKGKGKATATPTIARGATPSVETCGPHRGCQTAIVVEASGSTHPTSPHNNNPPFDPDEQLREWLTRAGRKPDGTTHRPDRNKMRLPYAPHFTEMQLKAAATFAASELDDLDARFRSLREYLTRDPYQISYADMPQRPGTSSIRGPKEEEFEGMDKESLQDLVYLAANVIDHYVVLTNRLTDRIRWHKMAHARDGNWSEIQDLLRLGIVDQEWVAKECKV